VEAQLSSTWRELKCAEYTLQSLKQYLTRQKVNWFTDNQNVETIVRKGSIRRHLQIIAVQYFQIMYHTEYIFGSNVKNGIYAYHKMGAKNYNIFIYNQL
jgi:tRNA(Ile)-lysidine synthase TilS/MesJ